MRILKVTQSYYPFLDRGGPAIKVRSIARALVGLGHRITVVTADLGFGVRDVQLAAATRSQDGWRSNLDAIETHYLAALGHYRNLTVNPGVLSFCRRRLRDFDIVHIYGLYDTLGPCVAWYCRKFGLPYVVEPLGMTRPIDRGFVLKRVWRWATGSYLNKASSIVTTSQLERAELVAEGFSSQQVILRYNGIDPEDFCELPAKGSFRKKMGIAECEPIILFMGRLIPRKGADLLIESLPRLNSSSVKLVIAGPEGEAGYISSLRALARARQVDTRVMFVGPLYGEDKKAALADADVFALPSRYENFGNAAAEAIACGTPAVVSDQCGIAPLIDGRAGLVAAYDSGAVAKALAALLENKSLHQQFQRGCHVVAEELSWGKLVQVVEQCYADAMRRFSPSPAALKRQNTAAARAFRS